MAHAYGTRLSHATADAHGEAGLGEHFGAGLYEAELRHLVENEWARTVEDVLWRRSKLGLWLNQAQVDRVAAWLGER
jgi:glycerol-3-phosphate dehydrogenase